VIPFVEVAIGEGSRVVCTRCGGAPAEPTFRPADEVVAEATAACRAWKRGPGPNVRLTGAEPFAHPELPRIVAGVTDAGCRRLGIDTDAVGMRSVANAHGALVAGVRHVRFTVLAGTEGLHDALAGTPGLLDATREGIASYRQAAAEEGLDVSITAAVPICRHNLSELPSAVAVAVECGVERVEVRLSDGGVEIASAIPWTTAACDTGVINGVWVEVEGIPFCLLPGYDLHVADAVRARAGAKPPVCRECALDGVCGGAPADASTDQLAALTPPAFATQLAPRIARARAAGASR
jgi:hypothetical protein